MQIHTPAAVLRKGVSAFQIKCIALLCMTVDHIAAFGGWTFLGVYQVDFRLIGRIAAPLFLFILVQSARRTHDRRAFVKRLYLAGMCVGLADTAFDFLLGDVFGLWTFSNILFTFFYVVLYIDLIEKGKAALAAGNRRAAAAAVGWFLLSLVPCALYGVVDLCIPAELPWSGKFLIRGLRDALLPDLLHVEYGAGFVLLGLALYFAATPRRQCAVFGVFCLFCIAGAWAGTQWMEIYMVSSFANIFFDFGQCWMILALPFMLLYNGERGRRSKWFFYWYYPLHRYAVIILSACLGSAV